MLFVMPEINLKHLFHCLLLCLETVSCQTAYQLSVFFFVFVYYCNSVKWPLVSGMLVIKPFLNETLHAIFTGAQAPSEQSG